MRGRLGLESLIRLALSFKNSAGCNGNPALYEQTKKKKELVHIPESFQSGFLTLSISLLSSVVTHPHVGSPHQLPVLLTVFFI